MKATEFNVYNIKEKYDFKNSDEFLSFLEEQLKLKEEDKKEAVKLLDELDYQFSGIEEEGYDKEFVEFTKNARKGILKRIERDNAGIVAIKNDIQIVINQTQN